MRRCAFGGDHPGDAMREHASLARARAGQDQHRPDRCGDRGALRVVECVENRGGIHRGREFYPTRAPSEA